MFQLLTHLTYNTHGLVQYVFVNLSIPTRVLVHFILLKWYCARNSLHLLLQTYSHIISCLSINTRLNLYTQCIYIITGELN